MEKRKLSLTIGWLYPDLMSTYGDRGNIIILKKRCEWRGISADVRNITLNTQAELLRNCDLVFMGGAQDRQQKIIEDDFLKHKGPIIRKLVENNIPALFVCAAYQAVGRFYKPYQGQEIKGLGLFDIETIHPGDQAKRLIGNVVAEVKSELRITNNELRKTIVGFENHGGKTYLGADIKPLAKVIKGFGNNGEDGFEGAIYKNAIGSYFHGPILSKNPNLADWLIKRTLEVKYQKEMKLALLDDTLEWQAHNFIMRKMRVRI